MGKNYLKLSKLDEMNAVLAKLGGWAPADFLEVSVDQKKIPYTHFIHKKVVGEKVPEFDLKTFPLKNLLILVIPLRIGLFSLVVLYRPT